MIIKYINNKEKIQVFTLKEFVEKFDLSLIITKVNDEGVVNIFKKVALENGINRVHYVYNVKILDLFINDARSLYSTGAEIKGDWDSRGPISVFAEGDTIVMALMNLIEIINLHTIKGGTFRIGNRNFIGSFKFGAINLGSRFDYRDYIKVVESEDED